MGFLSRKKLIHSVERVEYAFLLRNPPHLNVRAEGKTSTGGWSEFELRLQNAASPARDGILELEFVATPPDFVAQPDLTAIAAEIIWKEDVNSLRGVRVYSASNEATVIFGDVVSHK